ncbi:MAG: alpha-L-arabinofuranosidase [Verrucomicrobiota bacterium]|nr:alpha-L-arabinofuranosidase [Verrucomicrobiota bacterium]
MSLLSAVTRRFACVLFLSPVLALAQSVTVTVNTGTAVRTVDERVFGLNATMWDGEAGSAQTVNLLQQAGVRTIRIPGGSLSDEYHWRVNKTLNNTWTWASGMNKFADLITGLNAQAFVTVNYGSGTPEEAAAWVAYANAATTADAAIGTDSTGYNWQTAGTWAALRAAAPLGTDDGMNFLRRSRATPYALKYWEIGNENYGSWETDQQAVQWDPFTYATRARDYITRMKAVDPTIKIGVVVQAGEDELDAKSPQTPLVTNPRTNVAHKGWTPRVLARLKELGVTPDAVIYHRYEQAPKADAITWGGAYESDAGLLQRAKTWPEDATKIRQMLSDYLGTTAGAGVEILVTENNSVYSQPGKQTTSLVNGLFLADSIGHVLQTGINALLWWDLRNGTDFRNNNGPELYGWRGWGDYGILTSAASGGPATSYEGYPTYYAFKLLSKFARHGDTVVQATSTSQLLTVFAVSTLAGDTNLLVINKDPAASLTANFTVNGFTPASSASVFSYGKPQDDAAKPGGSGATDLASSTMNISGATFSASFAPYSMTVIALAKGSTTPTTPTPPTPTTPPPSSGGGGGGGGAPSLWFVGVLGALAVTRFARRI